MASILAVNAHFVSLAATAQRFDVGFFFFCIFSDSNPATRTVKFPGNVKV